MLSEESIVWGDCPKYESRTIYWKTVERDFQDHQLRRGPVATDTDKGHDRLGGNFMATFESRIGVTIDCSDAK